MDKLLIFKSPNLKNGTDIHTHLSQYQQADGKPCWDIDSHIIECSYMRTNPWNVMVQKQLVPKTCKYACIFVLNADDIQSESTGIAIGRIINEFQLKITQYVIVILENNSIIDRTRSIVYPKLVSPPGTDLEENVLVLSNDGAFSGQVFAECLLWEMLSSGRVKAEFLIRPPKPPSYDFMISDGTFKCPECQFVDTSRFDTLLHFFTKHPPLCSFGDTVLRRSVPASNLTSVKTWLRLRRLTDRSFFDPGPVSLSRMLYESGMSVGSGIPTEAFRNIAAFGGPERCPLCENFKPGFFSSFREKNGLVNHIEEAHSQELADAVTSMIIKYNNNEIYSLMRSAYATFVGTLVLPEMQTILNQTDMSYEPEKNIFLTRGELIEHVASFHGSVAAIRSGNVLAIVFALAGILFYDQELFPIDRFR